MQRALLSNNRLPGYIDEALLLEVNTSMCEVSGMREDDGSFTVVTARDAHDTEEGHDSIEAYLEALQRFHTGIGQIEKRIKSGFLARADMAIEQAWALLEDEEHTQARPHIQTAATIYDRFGQPINFTGAMLAWGEFFYSTAKHPNWAADDADRHALSHINPYIAQQVRKWNIKGGRGKGTNHKALRARKERRATVRKMKSEGSFRPGQRWPKSKYKQYHRNKLGVKTGLTMLQMKAAAYAQMDDWTRFEETAAYSVRLARSLRDSNISTQVVESLGTLRDASTRGYEMARALIASHEQRR